MENRHAYLLMIHNNLAQFKILLQCLDYEKNDIYVHVDKKVKKFNKDEFSDIIKKGKLFFLNERLNIRWGGFTQIKCELNLLKEATKIEHSYYHLISGADLPLKSQEEIYNFFESNYGTEYVHFDSKELKQEYKERVNKYYFFTGKHKNIIKKIANKIALFFQFNVNRIKNNTILGKGANWFTITHRLALYVLVNEKMINKMYKFTVTADEIFLQSLVLNSEFKENLYNKNYDDNYSSILYSIDWNRGNPYVYRKEDYDLLIKSNMLFARIFDMNIDSDVIYKIRNKVVENG